MKKKYDGKYKITPCFVKDCDGQGTNYNPQRIPACTKHKDTELKLEECPICKGFAELKDGKFGKFILCAASCGCISLKKYRDLI